MWILFRTPCQKARRPGVVPETSFHRSVAMRILLEEVHACLARPPPVWSQHYPTFDGNILTASKPVEHAE
jgi:hypothetical protein